MLTWMTRNVTIWGRHLRHSFLNILHHGLCHLPHHLKILHLLHAHLPGQWWSMGAVPPDCLTIPPPFVRDAARSSFRTTGVDSIRSCTCIWYLPWHTSMMVRCPIQAIQSESQYISVPPCRKLRTKWTPKITSWKSPAVLLESDLCAKPHRDLLGNLLILRFGHLR